MKNPPVECLGVTSQESYPSVVRFNPLFSTSIAEIRIKASQQAGSRDEIIPPNNISDVHTGYSNLFRIYSVSLTLHSGSIFPHASNLIVRGGNYYAAGHITLQGKNSPFADCQLW